MAWKSAQRCINLPELSTVIHVVRKQISTQADFHAIISIDMMAWKSAQRCINLPELSTVIHVVRKQIRKQIF